MGITATAPAIGTITPTAGVTKAYSLGQGSTGCTVNSGTGVVRGTAAGTDNCKVKLTLSKTNYNDLFHTYTFSVALGEQALTWTPGAATIQHTQELVLAAVGGADASSATITYAVTSAGATGCDFKGTSGANARTLTFDAAGTCQVTASATRSEYNTWSQSHSITVTNNPPVDITWSGYPNSNRVAYGSTASPSTPTYDPVGASGTYSHSGSACSVTSDGTLTPSAPGTCQVTLSATATNRETGTVTVTVTVEQGSQSAPAASNIYGSSPSLVTGGTLTKTGSLSGGHGTLSYRTASSSICQVDSSSATITALRDGDCAVEAKWGGDTNYEASPWGTVQTVTVGLGTLVISDPGSFTGNLVVGGASLTPSAPSTTPTGATFSYALKTNEADCTLDSTTGTTDGTVSAASVAVTAGTTACTIVLTATKTGYSPATREISVNLEAASLVFANPPVYEGEGFWTDGTTPVGITHLPTQDDNGVAVAWSFAVAGSRGDNSQSDVCSVDDTAGSATRGDITAGSSVADGDICTITLTGTTTASGYQTYSQQFTLEAGVVSILELSGGADFYCVRMSGGRVKCWGENFNGRLGLGGTADRGDDDGEMGSNLPFLNFGTQRAKKLASRGHNRFCAIMKDDSLRCWGKSFGDTPTTVNVGTSRTVVQVTSGHNHTCAVLDDASLKCWGSSYNGELGYGDNIEKSGPPTATVNLGEGRTALQVTAGESFTCALLDDGSVKCWGKGSSGRLGHGDDNNRHAPEATATVNLGRSAVSVTAGEYHVCALLNDGSAKCWGYGYNGMLGNGSTASRNTPVSVNLGQGVSVKVLKAGGSRTCAILSDDTLRCWGANNKGQLGQGDTTIRRTPPTTAVNLGTGRTVKMISLVSRTNICALLDNGTVKCWGENTSGALGAGANPDTDATGPVIWGDGADEMGDELPVVDLL